MVLPVLLLFDVLAADTATDGSIFCSKFLVM